MNPWVSIIVPVYNVEKYLDRCVKSLVNQTFTDLEIILVDDGSTDSSGKLCDQYEKEYKQIRVIHKKNGGLGSARNEGLKFVKGKFVAFVDSDDWMDIQTYEILYQKSQEICPDIITYGYKKIKHNEIIYKGISEFNEGLYHKTDVRNLILPNSIAQEKAFNQVVLPVQMSACMCIYKNSFLKENKIQFESEREVLNEDWLFNICCLCRAQLFLVVNKEFYNYDTRETSLSMSFKEDSYERKLNLYRRYKEELQITDNLNTKTEHRLKNFWLESIYTCYIIELFAPTISKKRIEKLFSDQEFVQALRKLNLKNSTLKGMLFKYIVKFRLNFIFKYIYTGKKKCMRIKT